MCESMPQSEKKEANTCFKCAPNNVQKQLLYLSTRPEEQFMALKHQTAGRDSVNVLTHSEHLINE